MDMMQFERNRELLLAVELGQADRVQRLIRDGAQVETVGIFGRRPLHTAAVDGNLPVVKCLLENGANIHAQANDDWQALHFAAERGRREVVEHLLAAGARIDAVDNCGRQALHHAVEGGYIWAMEALLKAGASPSAKDKFGKTPFDFSKDNTEVRAILQEWSSPEFLEERRQAANTKAVRDHWKRVRRHIATGPKPGL